MAFSRRTLAAVAVTVALAPRAGLLVLSPIGGLPAHLVASLFDPIGFVETSKGEFLLLDRRAHMVYAVDAARMRLREVLKVGAEKGNILEPGVLSLGPGDIFAVSDAPYGLERIQYFNMKPSEIGGFY